MGRRNKIKEKIIIPENETKLPIMVDHIDIPVIIDPIIKDIPVTGEIIPDVKIDPVRTDPIVSVHVEPPGITLNEFLCNNSQNRKLDSTFIKWFQKIDPSNPRKSLSEWYELNSKFLNEVV